MSEDVLEPEDLPKPCARCGEPLAEGTFRWTTGEWLCLDCKALDISSTGLDTPRTAHDE